MTDTPILSSFVTDLRNLLATRLGAIIARVERLCRRDLDGAQDSVGQIVRISRKTLVDVRLVTHACDRGCADSRFAQDVHDLLGLSLSAVTLKAELASRLLANHPDRARDQLAEIAELSRRAIGDVRSVSSGCCELRLTDELAAARAVLVSAEVDVRIRAVEFEVVEPQSSVLAMVTREGVTNVLRHSAAQHCEISLRELVGALRLDVVNDGLHGPSAGVRPRSDDGHGLRNLTERVGELGGELTARPGADRTFRLRAELPVPAICRM